MSANLAWSISRVGTGSGDDQFRLVFASERGDLVEVDAMIGLTHAVRDDFIKLAGEIHLRAVRQMSALREIHSQVSVARFEHRQIHRHVGLRTGVWLDIGVLGSEELFRSRDRQAFDDIHKLTATVVAATWIAFGVFVGEDCAGRFEDCGTGVIFGSDQFEPFMLANPLVLNSVKKLGKSGLQRGHDGSWAFAPVGLIDRRRLAKTRRSFTAGLI